MQLSARNQLKGTVKEVKPDAVMAEVVIALPDGQEISHQQNSDLSRLSRLAPLVEQA